MALGTSLYDYFLLFKLSNHTTHEVEICYTCVFQCFDDNHEQKLPWALFLKCLHFSNLQTIQVKICTQVYLSISMMSTSLRHFIYTNRYYRDDGRLILRPVTGSPVHSALDSQSLCLSSTPDRSWFFLFPSWPEYESTIVPISNHQVT